MAQPQKQILSSDQLTDEHAPDPAFDRGLYGAILRQKRISLGYKKADTFIADLTTIGCPTSKTSLYRIERGEQDPSLEFGLAANLILCGSPFSEEITAACLDAAWIDPSANANIARIARTNAKHGTSAFTQALESHLEKTDYEALLGEISWLDYQVYVSDSTDENNLRITIADASFDADDPCGDFDEFNPPFTCHDIKTVDDVEKAVIQHLKHDEVTLPNEQIKKLIRYAAKIVEPYVEQYGLTEL